jgi:hypothetical protein
VAALVYKQNTSGTEAVVRTAVYFWQRTCTNAGRRNDVYFRQDQDQIFRELVDNLLDALRMFRRPPAGEPSVFPLSRSQDWIRLLPPCSRFPFPAFGVIGEYSQLTANQCQATTEQLNPFPGRPSLTRLFLPQRRIYFGTRRAIPRRTGRSGLDEDAEQQSKYNLRRSSRHGVWT